MLTVIPDGCPGHDGGKDDAARSLIDEILREGARRMLAEALRVSRIRPVEALAEAAVERHGRLADVVRASLGLAALAGGIAVAAVAGHLTASAAAGTAIGLVATLVIAVALLAPWLTRITAAVYAAGLRRLGAPGRLAAANLAASAQGLSPVVSALVLAVALGGSLWFLQTSIAHATLQQSRAGLRASQVITTAGAGLPVGVAQAVRHVPGVASAVGIVRSTMFDTQGDEYTAEGADTGALGGVFQGMRGDGRPAGATWAWDA